MTTTTPARLGYRDLPRLMALQDAETKHVPSATSTVDVLWVLYDRVLRVDPGRPDHPERDRFLLSKGHGPMALYAVLAAKGFLDERALRTLARVDSPLGRHPDRTLVPGVEISSGSLGHGLPIGLGMALGLRAQGLLGPRVVVLLGDAELDEGSNHEAIAVAGALGVASLTAVVVDNDSSSLGWRGGIADRFAREGWSAEAVDGRDHDALERALTRADGVRPHAVVPVVEPKRSSR